MRTNALRISSVRSSAAGLWYSLKPSFYLATSNQGLAILGGGRTGILCHGGKRRRTRRGSHALQAASAASWRAFSAAMSAFFMF